MREKLSDEPVYIATVDNVGHYELFAFSAAGQKRLQHAKIDLDKLLSTPESDTSELLDKDIDPELPAILSMHPFPLRVPHQFDSKRSRYAEHVGVLSTTRDGRLHLWDKKRCGAHLLTSELPKGNIVWSHIDADALLAHILVRSEGLTLFTVNVVERGWVLNVLRKKLPEPTGKKKIPFTFCHHRRSLFFIFEETAEMYSLDDGSACGSLQLPHSVRANNGRFFRFGGEWFALSGELSPILEKIQPKETSIQNIFESSVLPCPFAVTKEGTILLLAGGKPEPIGAFELRNTSHGYSLSDDGRKISTSFGDFQSIFDLESRKLTRTQRSHDFDKSLNPEKHDLASFNPSPHIKFNSIDLSTTGRILLVSPKGITHVIQLQGSEIVLRPLSVKNREGYNPIRFEEVEPPGEARFKLQRAVWPCGSLAYLDVRGFLHIKHHSADLPEITFALRDGMLSGWTSDNQYFGQNFYIEPNKPQAANRIYASLEKITARILAHSEANPQ